MNAELIERLIGEASRAPDWRSGCAGSGRLPVYHLWGPVLYLTPEGEVVVDHEDEGGPARPADPAERDFALARAAERYPELAHLRPSRPHAAITCRRCDGHGRVALPHGKVAPGPGERALYCPACNSLGWTVTG